MAPHSSHLSPPRVRALDESQGRRVTWLELFFDLEFVVAVAQLGSVALTEAGRVVMLARHAVDSTD